MCQHPLEMFRQGVPLRIFCTCWPKGSLLTESLPVSYWLPALVFLGDKGVDLGLATTL